MSFQDFPDVVRKAAQSKGGKVRTKKGLATLSPERRREIAAMGGRVHAKGPSKRRIQKEAENRSDPRELVDEIFRDLE